MHAWSKLNGPKLIHNTNHTHNNHTHNNHTHNTYKIKAPLAQHKKK